MLLDSVPNIGGEIIIFGMLWPNRVSGIYRFAHGEFIGHKQEYLPEFSFL